jgi:hypothetical protein
LNPFRLIVTKEGKNGEKENIRNKSKRRKEGEEERRTDIYVTVPTKVCLALSEGCNSPLTPKSASLTCP